MTLIFDIETDGLYDDVTCIHCIGMKTLVKPLLTTIKALKNQLQRQYRGLRMLIGLSVTASLATTCQSLRSSSPGLNQGVRL
jgi:hypothetical protein